MHISNLSDSDRARTGPSGGSGGSKNRREYHSFRSDPDRPSAPRGVPAGKRVAAGIARAARGIHWYITSLMGDRAYGTYLAHHQRTHPEGVPLSERDFWRQKMDDQDRNPGARCC